MSSKKLKSRLNKLVTEFEARGIGVGFCSCPHSDGIHARNTIMNKLLYEGDWTRDPVEVCDAHRPRPVKRPNVAYGQLLLRLIPTIAELRGEDIGSAGNSFSGNGNLKPSRFTVVLEGVNHAGKRS